MDRYEELASTFERVAAICGVSDERCVLRPLTDACGWGRRAVSSPLLPSGVRHGVPYGISFVLGAGAPEVRVFVEPQAEPASLAAYREASARVADFIGREPGADVARLADVRDRFARIWYAVAFRPDAVPEYRAYLCLGGSDRDRDRAEVVARTLARLDATDSVSRGAKDFPTMIGIDLHPAPRLKLYVLRPDFVLDHPFARAMPGGDGPLGWLSCHFLESTRPRVAWHYSALRHAPDDEDLARRLTELLAREGIDPALYARLRREVPFRHHFVTYQRIDDAPRVTVYLLPEVRRT
jgi:hypothetical protein